MDNGTPVTRHELRLELQPIRDSQERIERAVTTQAEKVAEHEQWIVGQKAVGQAGNRVVSRLQWFYMAGFVALAGVVGLANYLSAR